MAASGENNRYGQQASNLENQMENITFELSEKLTEWEKELDSISYENDSIKKERDENTKKLKNVTQAHKNGQAKKENMLTTLEFAKEREKKRMNNTADLNKRKAELIALIKEAKVRAFAEIEKVRALIKEAESKARKPTQRRNGGKHTKSRRYHRKSHTRKRR